MGYIDLKVEQLVLDTDNPRITHADGQHDALQKVVRDQRVKLVRLAQSIVDKGLSPIERLMVLQVSAKPKQYIPLEGNRRVAVLTFLTQPEVMTGLDMPTSMKRLFERLADQFDRSKVEPIAGYEVDARDEGRYWIELRHNGENEGRGVVNWPAITAARWRKRDLGIQAFDLVMDHGGFTPDEIEKIKDGFPLSTLKRLMEVPDVRGMIGLSAKDGVLYTELPPAETIKALKKMVLDLANKTAKSRTLNKTDQMVEYVKGFDKADKPNLKKKTSPRPVEAIPKSEFRTKPPLRKSKVPSAEPPPRLQVVPRNCVLNVTDNRIEEIYAELRQLKLGEARNAIAVLLRVFADELIFRIESIAKMKSKIKLTHSDAISFLKFGLPKWSKKSLIYLDPPYYEQGRHLYYDYYQSKDHEKVAKFVTQKMNNRCWIVSYDNATRIRELYAGFCRVTYNVGYTAREQRTGKEVMFFSPKLVASDLIGPVQQIGRIKVAA